ncbi:hypothetical protein ACI3PF_21850, partial [Lactococcus lactis]
MEIFQLFIPFIFIPICSNQAPTEIEKEIELEIELEKEIEKEKKTETEELFSNYFSIFTNLSKKN